MNHQVKPNAWSCAITALAMTLDIPVEDVVKEAGHNGGKIVFPRLDEPMCRQGFHSQELVRIAWRHGYSMTPLELFPQTLSSDGTHSHLVWSEDNSLVRARFEAGVHLYPGILEGQGYQCHHAVYNSYGQIYDPDPGMPVYEFSFENCEKRQFYVQRFWIFQQHELVQDAI